MPKLTRALFLAACVWAAAFPALAATPTEFYLNLLNRGVVQVDAGEYAQAVKPLKIASFGLVDSLHHYQRAQVYLSVAYEKLGQETQTRESVRRVLAAQAIEPHYAALKLPEPVRTTFESAAKRVLGSEASLLFQSAARPVSSAAVPVQPTMASTAEPTSSGDRVAASAAVIASIPPAQRDEAGSTEDESPGSSSAPTQSAQAAPAQTASKPEAKPVEKTTVAPAPVPPPAAQAAPAQTTSKPDAKPEAKTTVTPQSSAAPAVTTSHGLEARFSEASAALNASRLSDARAIYLGMLADPKLSRDALLRAGEGLYRSRDFKGALQAFGRAGSLREGEQPYRYYVAVALYETGEHERARDELAAALPFIEMNADVARTQAKINGESR